jgi:hypothetical protein
VPPPPPYHHHHHHHHHHHPHPHHHHHTLWHRGIECRCGWLTRQLPCLAGVCSQRTNRNVIILTKKLEDIGKEVDLVKGQFATMETARVRQPCVPRVTTDRGGRDAAVVLYAAAQGGGCRRRAVPAHPRQRVRVRGGCARQAPCAIPRAAHRYCQVRSGDALLSNVATVAPSPLQRCHQVCVAASTSIGVSLLQVH